MSRAQSAQAWLSGSSMPSRLLSPPPSQNFSLSDSMTHNLPTWPLPHSLSQSPSSRGKAPGMKRARGQRAPKHHPVDLHGDPQGGVDLAETQDDTPQTLLRCKEHVGKTRCKQRSAQPDERMITRSACKTTLQTLKLYRRASYQPRGHCRQREAQRRDHGGGEPCKL